MQKKNYWRLHRYDGQYLYLKAAQHGIYHLFIAMVLSFFLKNISLTFSHQIPSHLCSFTVPYSGANIIDSRAVQIYKEQCNIHYYMDPALASILADSIKSIHNKEQNSSANTKIRNIELAWLICISFMSIASAFTISLLTKLSSYIKNKVAMYIYKQNNLADLTSMNEIFKDSPLDRIFFYSLLRKKVVLISLSSRKIYVGIIKSMGEPTESNGTNQEISLMPLMSGYRDKDTLNIMFTNNYNYQESTKENNLKENNFEIVIDSSIIETASLFDFTEYEKINTNMNNQNEKNLGKEKLPPKDKETNIFSSLAKIKKILQ
ncbi:hypothetical protein O4H51_18810 [Aeromonas hydrophila]|uniref:hypothetical protein n=1 Tax=Aeromonas hydrophila TaxID=644 RepID=UPI0022AF083E|nr:hypothetical protein [Aeromonas hydrophila]ELB2793865.1 hypothetical protein [Aeromonas hydrophila]MCZ4334912.1 hypothetical protein [Aeromonas hydrophila]